MNYLHAELNEYKREIRFPFPVHSLGYIEDSMTVEAKNFWVDRAEFCIRLDSEEKEAIDVLNGVEYRTPFPHVIVKDYTHEHQYRIHKKRKVFYLIYSKPVMMRLKDAGFDYKELLWRIRLTPRIFTLIQDLCKLIPLIREPFMTDRIDILSFELLTEIFSEREAYLAESTKMEKIEAIASLLRLHFMNEPDIDSLIAESGLSRRTFFRYWKMHYPESPHQYVFRLKTGEAARLLRETNESIRAISEKLNFSSLSYFALIFRKQFRMTPGEFRKSGNTPPVSRERQN